MANRVDTPYGNEPDYVRGEEYGNGTQGGILIWEATCSLCEGVGDE